MTTATRWWIALARGSTVAAVLVALTAPASAQSRRYGSGITVYANPDFRGDSATFRDDVPDLRGYSLNDKISSIDIPNGETWEVCQDVNYGNRCQVFSGPASDLRGVGWNDRISSMRRVAGRFGSNRQGGIYDRRDTGTIVLYDRPGYRGNSIFVTPESANVRPGNRVRSVQVRGGAWQLCDGSRRCATVSRSVNDIGDLGLDSRIVSVRPLYDSPNGRDRGRSNDQIWRNGRRW